MEWVDMSCCQRNQSNLCRKMSCTGSILSAVSCQVDPRRHSLKHSINNTNNMLPISTTKMNVSALTAIILALSCSSVWWTMWVNWRWHQQRPAAAADQINLVIYWYHVGGQTFCDICLGSTYSGVAVWPLMFLSDVCRRCILDAKQLSCRPILTLN